MNLSEALDAALPEIPKTRLARGRMPRVGPDLVIREDTLDGEPIFAILQRDTGNFFRFSPAQWQLAQLFDGVRTFDEIGEEFEARYGAPLSVEDAKAFAENLEDANFWYKSPQEKNLAMSQKLLSQRERRASRKSSFNLAHIGMSAWDPDRYFDWLDGAVGKYIYNPWCVLAAVLLFLFETSIFITYWNVIGPDAALYYNFAHKSALDLAQFWLLFMALGFIHESAHGLTCKHYGGQVHSMGLMFLYLMPAFFVDVTEVWVSATKMQRLATIIAGIWIEMIVCGIGMVIWSNTQAGSWLHDFAYQIILITGIAVILVNLNPLIKLDGYYFITEAIGVPDLKERSTAFLSAWFQGHVLRLPVEMTVVPRKRAPFYIFYAFASGAYSYVLLFFVVRLAYNIAYNWMAEFALIPAGWLAFVIFRSRLRSLRGVLMQMWKEHFSAGKRLTPVHLVTALVLMLVLFVPFRRDSEDAYYTIEPAGQQTLHSSVDGRVDAVLVHQGEAVRAGQPLLTMTSTTAESMHASAAADTSNASFQAFSAELKGQSIGGASAQQHASQLSSELASEAQGSLTITAPVDGTLLTADPDALLGQNVASGQTLVEIAATGPSVVRVYIPASALDRIPSNAQVALILPDRFTVSRLLLAAPAADAVRLPEGLIAQQDYKGIKLPVFYASRMTLPASAGNPRYGVGGEAKIFGARRSLASRIVIVLSNLAKAHLW